MIPEFPIPPGVLTEDIYELKCRNIYSNCHQDDMINQLSLDYNGELVIKLNSTELKQSLKKIHHFFTDNIPEISITSFVSQRISNLPINFEKSELNNMDMPSINGELLYCLIRIRIITVITERLCLSFINNSSLVRRKKV